MADVTDKTDGSVQGFYWLMDEVTKRTNGRVKFTHFYNESLMKGTDQLAGLQKGMIDLTRVPANYFPREIPLHSLYAIPTLGTDIGQVVKTLYELDTKDADYQAELKKWNLVYLMPSVSDPVTFLTQKPVQKLEDFKGVKVRTFGVYFPAVLNAWGATPVALAWGETNDALLKGTVQGVMTNTSALALTQRMYEVAKAHNDIPVGFLGHPVAFNADSWNNLPEDVRQVFKELIPQAADMQTKLANDLYKQAMDLLKSKGTTMVHIPADTAKDWLKTAGAAAKEVFIKQNAGILADPGAAWDKYYNLLQKNAP